MPSRLFLVLKWVAGLVAGLLLLFVAWVALNVRDVSPRPWPEALALPGNTVPVEQNLLQSLKGLPHAGPALNLHHCGGADCADLWRASSPQRAAWRAQNPALGQACSAGLAGPSVQAQELLPVRLSLQWVPELTRGMSDCHTWALGLALDQAWSGASDQAVQSLAMADRLDRAALAGYRSLLGHRMASAMWGRKLLVLQAVADAQPVLAPRLARFAELDNAQFKSAQLAWMAVEANFQAVAGETLLSSRHCNEALQPDWQDRLNCRLTGQLGQPEHHRQLVAERWLAMRAGLAQAQSVADAWPEVQVAMQASKPGAWAWSRHTLNTTLDSVSHAAYQAYLAQAADLQLSAEATRLWLASSGQHTWPNQASASLRARLRADGQALRYAPLSAEGASQAAPTPTQLPLRWPAQG